MTCESNVEGKELEDIVDNAVDNVVEDIEKIEKSINDPLNGFG